MMDENIKEGEDFLKEVTEEEKEVKNLGLTNFFEHCLAQSDIYIFVITDNFHHLLMKFHSYVQTDFYIPNDKN